MGFNLNACKNTNEININAKCNSNITPGIFNMRSII